MKTLSGKVAVVTGGAGGIGAAICQGLANAGANVIVGYNRSAKAAQDLVCQLASNAEQRHFAMHAPVTDSVGMCRLSEDVLMEFGRCDILVNCAGTTRFVPHEDLDGLDDQLIDEILSTNVRGVFASIRAFKSLLMAERKDGESALIINISSIAAVSAMGSNVIYCASKAAVDNMTKSLARALAPDIRVLSISPGLADTDFVKSLDVSWRNEQANRTPLKRLAMPEEVAAAVVAAATYLTFTTGAVLPIDGGRQLS